MNNCRKCNAEFPNHIIIDGKPHNLQRRKFCLDCSPFGSHNTKSDDPSRPSIPSNRSIPYSEWSEGRKDDNIHCQWIRRNKIKNKLINMFGGCCYRCGYNKHPRGLQFHHKDPTTKLFGLSQNNLSHYKWESVLEESIKCDLLCVNCHVEIENEYYDQRDIKLLLTSECRENEDDYIAYRSRLERNNVKSQAINVLGGCCQLCGYNKCIRGLQFHHRDRKTKSFGLSTDVLVRERWEYILLEINKCDLLCGNCHAEVEHDTNKSKYYLQSPTNI